MTDYKLTHTSPKLDPTTNRRSVGTILATRRDVYKDVTPIPTPAHLTDYIKADTITPHDGSPIIAITAYMPQIYTKEQEQTYKDILTWIQQSITTNHPNTTIFMGGDLQSTPHKEDTRLQYPPLSQLCDNTGLDHIIPKDIYTFTSAKTHIDHWLLRQLHTPQQYTTHNTTITTDTPEY